MRNIWFPVVLILITPVTVGQANAQSYPEFAKTDSIMLRDGTKIELRDGVNLSGRNLSNIAIHRGYDVLRDVNFSNSDLTGADLRETIFNHCSFRGTILTGVQLDDDWERVKDCDFTDALINGIHNFQWHPLTLEQIQSSRSWKTKYLRQVEICSQLELTGEIPPLSLTGFYLREAHVMVREEVDLTDADIQDARLYGGFYDPPLRFGTPFDEQHQDFYATGNMEMLMKTKNGKDKMFLNIRFTYFDFTGADFSGMDLSGVHFSYCKLTDANFTDAVITQANFLRDDIPNRFGFDGDTKSHTLTLEQIKQTWNYKHGVMQGITLPNEIRDALEAEKAAEKEKFEE